MSSRVVLRQVVFSHGRCVPPLQTGCMSQWLPRLPSEDVSGALDRCTMVLPRGGDGSYAPPAPSRGPSGFPWGHLSRKGAEQMSAAGRRFILGERHLLESVNPGCPFRKTLDGVIVRSVNRQCNIVSAQAFVAGAQESLRDFFPATWQGPVEVLLNNSEDLVTQVTPDMEAYPALVGEDGLDIQGLGKPMALQLLDVANALGPLGAELASLAPDNWEEAFDMLFCLEAEGLLEHLGPEIVDKVSALRHFRLSRWAAPLHAGGPEAAATVVGPLLGELFRAFDYVAEDSEDPGVPAPTTLYVLSPDTVAALVASFAYARADPSLREKLTWPSFGSSMEVLLVQKGGEPFLQIRHGGEDDTALSESDLLPYNLVRERFDSSCP